MNSPANPNTEGPRKTSVTQESNRSNADMGEYVDSMDLHIRDPDDDLNGCCESLDKGGDCDWSVWISET